MASATSIVALARGRTVQFESRAALTRGSAPAGSGSGRATRTRHTHTTHERTRAAPRLPHRTLACGSSYFSGRLVSGRHQALVLPPWRGEGTDRACSSSAPSGPFPPPTRAVSASAYPPERGPRAPGRTSPACGPPCTTSARHAGGGKQYPMVLSTAWREHPVT